MISPMPGPIRQPFAQAPTDPANAIALPFSLGKCLRAGRRQPHFGLCTSDCYPSPSLRSGPSQAGPTPFRSNVSGWTKWFRNCFEIRDFALESGTITTNQRGSSKCGSRLSSSLFSPRPLPAACRTLHRAGLRVPPAARSSRMRWTKTWLPVPPLAEWLALPPAGSTWACRPATPATDLTAHGRVRPTIRATGADRPGGPFILRA
jgi:hypothetical protein